MAQGRKNLECGNNLNVQKNYNVGKIKSMRTSSVGKICVWNNLNMGKSWLKNILSGENLNVGNFLFINLFINQIEVNIIYY